MSAPDPRADAQRLVSTFEPYRESYRRATQMDAEALDDCRRWSHVPVEDDPREAASATCEHYGERLRSIHRDYKRVYDALKDQAFLTPAVREAHERILSHLSLRSRSLRKLGSDFSRLARIEFPATPLGQVPPTLTVLRKSVAEERPASDPIIPILNGLKLH